MKHKRHELTVPATAESLKEIRQFYAPILERSAPPHAQLLTLALDECCSNIIKHRSRAISNGRIHTLLEVTEDTVRIQIDSFCLASEVDQIEPRDLEEVRPGGLGTHFVREIADRIDYIPSQLHPGSMSLVLEKRLRHEGDGEPHDG
jgi:anti-sigma regulatory factor (Ser/Thr protein kinase)